jgi:signal transduction histidine kinase
MTMKPDDLERMGRAMRHRLRNVASGIKAATTLLSSQLDARLQPAEREYFPLIIKECDALAELATRLGVLLEGEVAQKPVLLGSLVVQARQVAVARYPFASIRIQLSAAVEQTEVGGGLLTALKEIVVNAAEAAGRSEVLVTGECHGLMLTLTVQDGGTGMSEDDWVKGMQPFRLSRAAHLGIGLAIAHDAVGRLGGTLSGQRNPTGFCVTMQVPLERDLYGSQNIDR